VLFVRLYLEAISDGDDAVVQAWLKNENTALRTKPIDMIPRVCGLLDVIHYLEVRQSPGDQVL
jgi:Protein of unknown function (DUF2384)